MSRIILLLVAIFEIAASAPARADIVVVVNHDNSTDRLSREEVVDLYMGRRTIFPGGRTALPLDLPRDSALRADYYRILVGRTVAQVNAYWARLLFTGRATPPHIVADVEEVLNVVGENVDAIGYLDSTDANDSVKIVYRLK